MICGESAGIAACQALAEDTTVQQINMATYRQSLDRAGQVLRWTEELARLAKLTSQSRSQHYTFERLCQTCDKDGDSLVSKAEWDAGKAGWEWLFPIIDKSQDGQIDASEYASFQEYKKQNPHWREKRE